jgi:hypothetical protein
MFVRDSINKYRIDCGSGGVTEENLPLDVFDETDLNTWLNSLGIGTFTVLADSEIKKLTISQANATCSIEFLNNGIWRGCSSIVVDDRCVTDSVLISPCGDIIPVGTLCEEALLIFKNCEPMPDSHLIREVGDGTYSSNFVANIVQVTYLPTEFTILPITVTVSGIGVMGNNQFLVYPNNEKAEVFDCPSITSATVSGANANVVNIEFKKTK